MISVAEFANYVMREARVLLLGASQDETKTGDVAGINVISSA
jgi:hypothetical protein